MQKLSQPYAALSQKVTLKKWLFESYFKKKAFDFHEAELKHSLYLWLSKLHFFDNLYPFGSFGILVFCHSNLYCLCLDWIFKSLGLFASSFALCWIWLFLPWLDIWLWLVAGFLGSNLSIWWFLLFGSSDPIIHLLWIASPIELLWLCPIGVYKHLIS